MLLLWSRCPQSYSDFITFLQENTGLSGLLVADLWATRVLPPELVLLPPLVCLICWVEKQSIKNPFSKEPSWGACILKGTSGELFG